MSFANEYWEEFEKLSIDILKTYFKDIDTSRMLINRTKCRSDGGYDGIVIISSESNELSYKILSESKLRAISSKDLPLSDFAKTLVIAINMFANEVYIFTNLHFSKETQKRIKKFIRATNIKVKLVDIFQVTKDIDSLSINAIQKYSKTLVSELISSIEKHPVDRKTDIQNEIKVITPDEVIGNARKTLLKTTKVLLQHKSGILIVSGNQGSGKTLFIQHLISSLYNESNPLCSYVDMVQFSNINDFFITLLSIIWQIEALDISKFDENDIEEITSYIPDTDMSRNVKYALLDIITSGAESCFTSKDIMYNCLMKYLHKLYSPILKFQKQFLVFHNIDYATDFAKDILLMFIKRFYKDNIIIILESRNETAAVKAFLQQCSAEVPIIDEVKLNDFDDRDAKSYLHKKYNNIFSRKELKALEQICPRTPLLIDQIAQIFSANNINRGLLDDSLKSIYKLYKNPKYLSSINKEYVKHILCGYESEVKICAASIAFMDGSLDLNSISFLCSNLNNVINKLVETHLFRYNDNVLQIYHVSVLEPLRVMSYIEDVLVKNKIYKQLYDVIDRFNIFPKKKLIKKLCLALKLNKHRYILDNWQNTCFDLISERDYEVALGLLKDVESSICDELDNSLKFSLKLGIFQCYLSENIYEEDTVWFYIEDLDEIIIEDSDSISKTEFEEYLFWKAKYYLAVGQYEELINSINQYEDITAELYYIRALGIKHIYGIDECIKSLEQGIDIFPDDRHIKYSYYDHKLSKAFKYNVSSTKDYINDMKSYVDILSLEDKIHFEYNEQTALFYNNELDNVARLNDLMRIAFQNNLPVEQSRICNLIGQFYWINDKIELAIEYLSKAAELQIYTNHQTYWWISETNLALLYSELHDDFKCSQLINRIFGIYSTKKWKKIKNFFCSKNVSTEKIIFDKEIVSFLLLLSLLYSIDEDKAKAIVKDLIYEENILFEKKWLSKKYLLTELYKKLRETSYYHSNHIMIKC